MNRYTIGEQMWVEERDRQRAIFCFRLKLLLVVLAEIGASVLAAMRG